MMKLISIALILSLSSFLFGQESKIFSFDFGYGVNEYNMSKLNDFYIDSFAGTPENDLLREYVEKGNNFKLGVNYRLIDCLDVGLYGNYQFSSLKSRPWKKYTENNGKVSYSKGEYELRTEAISVGISSTFYFSELLNFTETSYNRVHLGLELNGGVSFAKVSAIHTVYTFKTYDLSEEYFSKEIFQGQLGLKIEYDFTQTPIFTTLGLRAGYQFLKSGTARDAADQEWLINDKYPINLDFSGFYFGVYLKLGK